MTSHQFILDFDGERIVGENPFAVFERKNGEGDALNELRQQLNEPSSNIQMAVRLALLAYDFARALEPRAFGDSPRDDLQIPDIRLTFFSNLSHTKTNFSSPISQDLKPKTQNPKPNYLSSLARIKDYIAAGDIYQANLTRRFEAPLPCSPTQLYQRLTALNAAPFSALLGMGRFSDCFQLARTLCAPCAGAKF